MLKPSFRRLLASLLCGLALSSCGPIHETKLWGEVDYIDRRTYFDAYLSPWIDEYINWVEDEGLAPAIPELRSVHCIQSLDGYPGVHPTTIGVTYYRRDGDDVPYSFIVMRCYNDPLYDKALLFHELTHAYFHLDHSKKKNEIQYPDIPSLYFLQDWALRTKNLLVFIKSGGREEELANEKE